MTFFVVCLLSAIIMETASSSRPSGVDPTPDNRAFIKGLPVMDTPSSILQQPLMNKGLAFDQKERDAYGLHGFIPAGSETPKVQLERVMKNYKRLNTDLERYEFLEHLHNTNEKLYYQVLVDNVESMMPMVYTPTVGLACQNFSSIWREPRGMWLSVSRKGTFADIVARWPQQEVDIIVVTDGSRILGLGDLGANGMGIPIGKLALYVAAAGMHPAKTLPVMIDVGTENKQFLNDPCYIGERRPRVSDKEFYEIVDEFMTAVRARWPKVLIQWEDFSNDHAFKLLAKYRDDVVSFNDDIQGTGGVVLAGILGALRITQGRLQDQRIVFYGAGAAGVGVADLIRDAIIAEGLDEIAATRRFWLVDTKGLVTKARGGKFEPHKVEYVRDDEPAMDSLLKVVNAVKPTILIGLSRSPKAFNVEIIKAMNRNVARPIIFALSNPTSKSECSAQEAYEWTNGAAVFASGSPFGPVTYRGRTFVPGQGNNMYIFPGVGLGAVVAGIKSIPNEVFVLAARTLAGLVKPEHLERGTVYPEISSIRSISLKVAADILRWAREKGVVGPEVDPKADPEDIVSKFMWTPEYAPLDIAPPSFEFKATPKKTMLRRAKL